MPATAPFRLFPTFRERPWGVTSLAPWFGGTSGTIGEAWFTASDNPTSLGRPLGELVATDPAGVLGTGAFPGNEPLLLKFLFTAQRLSVQVHPDDAYARAHHGSAGKTEAWHVLRADAGSQVGLGFIRALSPDAARAAATTGAIEQLIDWRPARAGDSFLVPAGTVHAIGAGLTIVEVQEPSDVTYRLYDYGRPRELHLDQGFTVADLGPYRVGNERARLTRSRELLTTCPFFTIERVAVDGSLHFAAGSPFYHLLVVVEGDGILAGHAFHPGAVFLVPTRTPSFDIVSERAVLVVAYTAEVPTTALPA